MKRIVLVLVLLLAGTSLIMATDTLTYGMQPSRNESSIFDLGIVTMVPYRDISSGEFSNYMPGVRMQFNIRPWFGLVTDIQARSFDFDTQYFRLIATLSPVVRAILGPVEPYLGIGTSYGIILDAGTITSMAPAFRLNVRSGINFKILKWLSVGAEGNVWTSDPVDFIKNFTGDLLLDHLDVGVNVTFRF
ncbi:hypothetical protein [Sphaerochaeta pleomorpha]|nr:hypothetical protein [Sphaerochaeta pleomorpha]